MGDQKIGKIEREFQTRKIDVFLAASAEAGAGPEGKKKWLNRHVKYRQQWEKQGWVPNTGLTGAHLRNLESEVNKETTRAARTVISRSARVIIAAYRSTLTTPPVLAKPVTVDPAPNPDSPTTPTPTPTPTPTNPGPASTKTQPSPYPSLDDCLSPTAPLPPYNPEEFPHGTKKKGVGQSIIWRVRILMWFIRPKVNFSLCLFFASA